MNITQEELAQINRFARTELTEEQVYIFSVRLCDNEVDRDFERFDTDALTKLGELFVGKSGIFDHQWSAQGQTARIYRTEVIREPARRTAAQDSYQWLKAWAYLLRTEKNGGFGILDEINMAKNEALAVLHAALDFRRAIDVPGYERVEVDPAARFIGTMNYGYAGTRELNEALTSRFVVIQMPAIDDSGLERLLGEEFPTLEKKYRGQFVQLFLDLQKKCENAEISSKALDLRGLLDALRLIRRGVSAGMALDMGITNKAFDSYEQGLIRDVIAARIPAKLDRSRLFTD